MNTPLASKQLIQFIWELLMLVDYWRNIKVNLMCFQKYRIFSTWH